MQAFRSHRQTNFRKVSRKNLPNSRYHSSYVQQLAWLDGFIRTKLPRNKLSRQHIKILSIKTHRFRKADRESYNLSDEFLRAIIDGVHSEFTTQEILHKYQLGSSANVSTVKRALVKKELVEIEKRQVIIPDPGWPYG